MKYRARFKIVEMQQDGWDSTRDDYEITVLADSKIEIKEKIKETETEYTKRRYGDFGMPLYLQDCYLLSVEEVETEKVKVVEERVISAKDVTKKFK